MPKLSLAAAKARVKRILDQYHTLQKSDHAWLNALESGKIYELFSLSKLLAELKARGFQLRFRGNNIQFKMAPGGISSSDPHFEVRSHGKLLFEIYTDIEFTTLGSEVTQATDKSSCHELDIAVVDAGATGLANYNQIALGIECKSNAFFVKSLVRQALGIRRELSFLRAQRLSKLAQHDSSQIVVPAEPASEFWLTFSDPKGKEYCESPEAFGIEFKHWQP